ncbi:MAG: hypothetical protein Q4A82_01070 [Corynebacterium sp.]|nr:hypothetical protein [Corynebacterium sp.]
MPTNAAILFQPGWILRHRTTTTIDPLTGNKRPATWIEIPGIGVLQQPLWTGVTETSPTGIRDERLIMFLPDTKITVTKLEELEINSDDEFHTPNGHIWHAITDAIPRGIPGRTPEYFAVMVRRAKEKEKT